MEITNPTTMQVESASRRNSVQKTHCMDQEDIKTLSREWILRNLARHTLLTVFPWRSSPSHCRWRPSLSRISCLHCLRLRGAQAIPCIDIAVVSDCSNRHCERRTVCGYHFGPDGDLHPVEFFWERPGSQNGSLRVTSLLLQRCVRYRVAKNGQAVQSPCAELRQSHWFVLLVVALYQGGVRQTAQRRI